MRVKMSFLFLICFLIQGCSSSKIVSKKSSDFKEPVSKILVVVNDQGKAFEYFRGLKNLLYSEFLKLKVHSKIVSIKDSEDPEQAYQKELKAFQPESIMFIELTDSKEVEYINHGYFNGNFFVSFSTRTAPITTDVYMGIQLFYPGQENLIWSAKMKSSAAQSASYGASRKLILKMIKDRIIVRPEN